MPIDRIRAVRRIPFVTYAFFFGLFGSTLLLIHTPFLKLPFFWDELGQFVPAALDILRTGAWIPHSATPNVHPPGVMAYLAAVWSLTGYSIPATRIAMLLLASLAVLVVFLLAIELARTVSRTVTGVPAFVVVLLLSISPLFFAQAMMAQLDMPAMLLTCLALLLFLQDRFLLSAAACTLLVLVKETGAIVPVLFAAWLFFEKKRPQATYFIVPLAALGFWLLILARSTGHLLGNPEFAHYNIAYQLHAVRIVSALFRRLYYLFVAEFRWIGTIAIVAAWRGTAVFKTRPWNITAALVAAHVILFSMFGGAALERYLLPVLPMVYVAMALAWSMMGRRRRVVSKVALAAGLAASNLLNPPYPFPYENNLAVVDFVQLHATAAEYLDRSYTDQTIATAWPLAGALARPEFGYVMRKHRVREVFDFHTSNVAPLGTSTEIFVIYSRTWEPQWSVLRINPIIDYLRRYYDYEPQIAPKQIQTVLDVRPVIRWERRGQWIEIYAKPGLKRRELL
jgi:4-amino-4-deoxy-L-arabinose transferase-like glycosyltransferase